MALGSPAQTRAHLGPRTKQPAIVVEVVGGGRELDVEGGRGRSTVDGADDDVVDVEPGAGGLEVVVVVLPASGGVLEVVVELLGVDEDVDVVVLVLVVGTGTVGAARWRPPEQSTFSVFSSPPFPTSSTLTTKVSPSADSHE